MNIFNFGKKKKFLKELKANLQYLIENKKSVFFCYTHDEKMILSFGFNNHFFIFEKKLNTPLKEIDFHIEPEKEKSLYEKNDLLLCDHIIDYCHILKNQGETLDSEHFLQKIFDHINQNRIYYQLSFEDVNKIFKKALENPYYDLRILSPDDGQNWVD